MALMASTTDNYRARIGAWVKARLLRDPRAVKIDCEGLDLFVVRDALSPGECGEVIAAIEKNLTPSGLMSPTPDPEFRTSQSSNLHPNDPVVAALEERINAIVGIQAELGETVQGQRYAVGQQFKPHWDYFFSSEPYWPNVVRSGGQRTWTAMMFLNQPEAGGHTIFTKANVSVRPRAGNLVVWNNLTPEGEPNEYSMHTGSPVEAGVKYVVTKWYRERPWDPLPEEMIYYSKPLDQY